MSIQRAVTPVSFVDPITNEVMTDPVVCNDGRTYDRATAEKLERSPFTRERLSILVPNIDVRSSIFEARPDIARRFEELRVKSSTIGATQNANVPPPLPFPSDTMDFLNTLSPGNSGKRGYLEYPDGTRYIGESCDGRAHGKGVQWCPNGAVVIGQFARDRTNGPAEVTFPNGARYTGYLENGKWFGHVVIERSNGYRFDGTYEGGQKHGPAKETLSGRRYNSEFDRGKLVKRVPVDNGTA